MKTGLLLLVSLVVFQSCSAPKGTFATQKKFPISIEEISKQSWVSTEKDGEAGTTIKITFQKIVPKTIILKQLFWNHKRVEALKMSGTEFHFLFKGNPNEQIISSENTIEPPIAISPNQVLLEYLDKGYKKYFVLANITEKPPLVNP